MRRLFSRASSGPTRQGMGVARVAARVAPPRRKRPGCQDGRFHPGESAPAGRALDSPPHSSPADPFGAVRRLHPRPLLSMTTSVPDLALRVSGMRLFGRRATDAPAAPRAAGGRLLDETYRRTD